MGVFIYFNIFITNNTKPFFTHQRPKTEEELKQCSKAGDEFGAISATLDGKPIENLDKSRSETSFFNITIVKDNIFDVPPGTYKSTADGFFVS